MAESASSSTPTARRIPWRPILLVGAVVALLVLARALGLGERLGELREWIGSLGALGPFVYVGIYVVAVVVAIPGAAITLLAGALFGSVMGTAVVSAGSVIGATLAFLIARYFARDSIAEWLSRNERFAKLDAMTARHGAIMVAITRLVPIFPFNLLNYGFGLTRVPLWTYVFWSWLCMLPGTVLYVAGGDTLTTALAEGDVPWHLIALVVGILVFVLALGFFMRRYLQRKESLESSEVQFETAAPELPAQTFSVPIAVSVPAQRRRGRDLAKGSLEFLGGLVVLPVVLLPICVLAWKALYWLFTAQWPAYRPVVAFAGAPPDLPLKGVSVIVGWFWTLDIMAISLFGLPLAILFFLLFSIAVDRIDRSKGEDRDMNQFQV